MPFLSNSADNESQRCFSADASGLEGPDADADGAEPHPDGVAHVDDVDDDGDDNGGDATAAVPAVSTRRRFLCFLFRMGKL